MMNHAQGLLTAALLLSARSDAGELRRRGDWGFSIAADSSGVVVSRVREGSAADTAGLRVGDRLRRINDAPIASGPQFAAARRLFRAGSRVRFVLERDARERNIAFTLPALPLERLEGCDVWYGSVMTPGGYRVRTVFSRPSRATGRVPTLVFIPWLSCDAVEGAVPGDGWLRLLRAVAERSGWALYRVEKPGVGDSEGPDCSRNDLDADLGAFRAALDDVRRTEGVDTDHIVLMGGSVGGALAPLLARGREVAGVISCGGFSRTWLEHMLEIERRRLTLDGASPADVNRAMRGFADFYPLYLNGNLTPAQVLARRPDLAPLWYDAPDGQYGRPAAYYQQLQRLDVEDAWAAVEVPVLILHGEYDWIMSRSEAEHAAEIVNARHPGRATLEILPRTDHNLGLYASPLAAYRDEGGSFNAEAPERIIRWLHAIARGAPVARERTEAAGGER
jgi:pimeloyl-ACP methyl ester carboxylesterase